MAHILLLDVPGGNDFSVLDDAVRDGHEVTFYTSDLAHYHRQGEITELALTLAREIIEIRPFDYPTFEHSALEVHRENPFDAILCLIDIRLVEASRLAEKLGLRFLNLTTTRLLRDKFSVREVLAKRGVRQPRFALAKTVDELRQAVTEIGYPALVKPSDGYGSQNVSVLFSEKNLNALAASFLQTTLNPTDYGFGVCANNRFSIEQYISGSMIGCDVFSDNRARTFLGINHKLMFAPPSFAMRGSCFPSNCFNDSAIRDYAFEILDAVNFDFGAAHIEMIVADDGPYLVEVNPRLVSAQIPYQMGYALERSVYVDLINLHLGSPLPDLPDITPRWFSVIRWITARRPGILERVRLPQHADPRVRRVALFKEQGDAVRPPMSNGDRIGYVIAVGKTRGDAEQLADGYVRDTLVELR